MSISFGELGPTMSEVIFILAVGRTLRGRLGFDVLESTCVGVASASSARLIDFGVSRCCSGIASVVVKRICQRGKV